MQRDINPYIAARHEWDERYGSLISQARQWRAAALLCAFTAVLAVGGLLWMTRQSRVVPFVIALDGDRPVALGQAQQVTEGDRRLVGSALFTWLQDLRNVTSDPIAQRRAIDRVYTHIAQGSQAQRAISDWYRASPPFERSRTATVSVDIRLILPVSDKTFQLEWTETTHDAYGAVKSRDTWKGSFVTAREVPADEQILRQNPLGIYVVEANWNKVL